MDAVVLGVRDEQPFLDALFLSGAVWTIDSTTRRLMFEGVPILFKSKGLHEGAAMYVLSDMEDE